MCVFAVIVIAAMYNRELTVVTITLYSVSVVNYYSILFCS